MSILKIIFISSFFLCGFIYAIIRLLYRSHEDHPKDISEGSLFWSLEDCFPPGDSYGSQSLEKLVNLAWIFWLIAGFSILGLIVVHIFS